MLTSEQAQNIKKQLLGQIDQLDIPNKEQLKTSIQAMDNAQLEEFLKQNNLMQPDGSMPQGDNQPQKCIFCSIAKGETPSIKIYEDDSSSAALELNPASKGHIIVIPKDHVESADKMPQPVLDVAKKIGEHLKTKLNPKDILIENTNIMGHEIINVLPVYENESLDSPRQKAEEKDLLELQKILEIDTTPAPVEVSTEREIKKIDGEEAQKLWLPKRIP